MLRVSLITLGDPQQMTGGYLYHRRMAAAASTHDAIMRFVSCADMPFPFGVLGAGRALTHACANSDVVVVDSIAAWPLAPWTRRSASVPHVVMSHQVPGGIDHGPARTVLQARLDESTYRRAQLLMVASETLADDLRARGFPSNRIRVVPPGRDPAPTGDRAPDLRAGRRAAFLCVGNWIPRKGIHELLEAFARLPPDAATLHLVGDERVARRYGARVRARSRQPDLAGRVVTHGPLPAEAVAAMYEGADAFVLPSTKEPYGTVFGEALAAGLPVVGWDAGTLPHLATHGREGLIVSVGDVNALAAALLQLAEDDGYRRRLAHGARRRGRMLPTWEDTARDFYAALRMVAAV